MKGVLRDLLSPERVRRSWAVEEPAAPVVPADEAVALVSELRAMVTAQLPGEDGLLCMVDLLAQKVAAWDATRGGEGGMGAADIEALASRIGDVIDALTVAGRRRGGPE
ncbi:MAG: hypothetical protein AMXMBFR64_17510 [Myxococcales bacterium]